MIKFQLHFLQKRELILYNFNFSLKIGTRAAVGIFFITARDYDWGKKHCDMHFTGVAEWDDGSPLVVGWCQAKISTAAEPSIQNPLRAASWGPNSAFLIKPLAHAQSLLKRGTSSRLHSNIILACSTSLFFTWNTSP